MDGVRVAVGACAAAYGELDARCVGLLRACRRRIGPQGRGSRSAPALVALVPYAVLSEAYCAFVQLRAHSVFAGLALSSAAVAVDFPTATYALTCLAVLCAAMRSPLAAGIAQLLAAAFGLVARGWWPCLLIAAAGMLLSPKAFAVSCLAPSIWACWMQRGGAHVLLWGTVGAAALDATLFWAGGCAFLPDFLREQPFATPAQGEAQDDAGRTRGCKRARQGRSTATCGSGAAAGGSGAADTASSSVAEGSTDKQMKRILAAETHYQVFGLEAFSAVDGEALKRAYRKLSMRVHPDKNGSSERASDAFKRLQNAYEVLSDNAKRDEYDLELQLQQREEQMGAGGGFEGAHVLESLLRAMQSGEALPLPCPKEGLHMCPVEPSRSKGQMRWCSECSTFHGAKQGDMWAEAYRGEPVLGLFSTTKVEYFCCFDGHVYNISDWAEHQGELTRYIGQNDHLVSVNLARMIGEFHKFLRAETGQGDGGGKGKRRRGRQRDASGDDGRRGGKGGRGGGQRRRKKGR